MLHLRREWQYLCCNVGRHAQGAARRLKPEGFTVTALPYRAPLSLVLARLGRAFTLPPENVAPPHDPVFLPDSFGLTPDQMQEMHYGQGREGRGRDQ